MEFKIGDKVKVKEPNHLMVRDCFPGEAIYQGESTNNSDCVALERLDGMGGSAQNGWWNYQISDLDKLELIKTNKTNFMANLNSMMKRLLDADTKTLIKADFINGDLLLTEEGKDTLAAILFEANKKELVKLAEEKLSEEKKEEKK